MFKFNTTYIVAAVFLLLIGCTDKEQQARSLGFSDAKEMQEMQFKGFKNKAAYALAQDQYNNIKNKKENLENYPRCAGSYEFIKCVADERKLKEFSRDNNWYVIPPNLQHASNCITFELKDYIKNLMDLNWNHSINEFEKEDGLPVAVQISVRQPGERQGEIYAYKGKTRCANEFNRRKNELDQESNIKEREINSKINRY